MKSVSDAKVAVFAQGVDTTGTETKGTVLIKSAEQLESYSRCISLGEGSGCVHVSMSLVHVCLYSWRGNRELCFGGRGGEGRRGTLRVAV